MGDKDSKTLLFPSSFFFHGPSTEARRPSLFSSPCRRWEGEARSLLSFFQPVAKDLAYGVPRLSFFFFSPLFHIRKYVGINDCRSPSFFPGPGDEAVSFPFPFCTRLDTRRTPFFLFFSPHGKVRKGSVLIFFFFSPPSFPPTPLGVKGSRRGRHFFGGRG